jgi:hypothetical protein
MPVLARETNGVRDADKAALIQMVEQQLLVLAQRPVYRLPHAAGDALGEINLSMFKNCSSRFRTGLTPRPASARRALPVPGAADSRRY